MRLYKDDGGRNTIDFSGEVSFSKQRYGIESDLNFNAGVTFANRTTYFIRRKKTKISRFIYAAKILWRFC